MIFYVSVSNSNTHLQSFAEIKLTMKGNTTCRKSYNYQITIWVLHNKLPHKHTFNDRYSDVPIYLHKTWFISEFHSDVRILCLNFLWLKFPPLFTFFNEHKVYETKLVFRHCHSKRFVYRQHKTIHFKMPKCK
jgi:hypothetical protein